VKICGAAFAKPNPDDSEEKAQAEGKQIQERQMPKREQQHERNLEADFKPQGGWWDDPNGMWGR